jgi:hypothetical protein
VTVPEAVVPRWSRRIVHPRLTLSTSDPRATIHAIDTALRGRGFRTTRAGDGIRAKRRPWFSWLAGSAVTSCVLRVQPVSATTVEVDVEARGSHPAPDRAAEALTRAAGDLAARGVEVRWGEWEAVP